MQPPAIDTELLALEKQYWDAIKNKDGSAATRLSDDRCIVVGPHGIGEIDKQALAGMVERTSSELARYRFDDREVHIRAVSDSVAVIAYKVHEELIVDGKPTTMNAFDSSVWVRRESGWVCAMHTEAIAGDPYGRH
jgi:hypothetical protein